MRLVKNCQLCINIVGTKRWYGNGMLFYCKCDTAMLTDGDNVRVTVPRWLARRIHRCMITSLTYNNTSMTAADQASYKPTTGNIIMLSTLLINHISCCFIKNRKFSHSSSPGTGWWNSSALMAKLQLLRQFALSFRQVWAHLWHRSPVVNRQQRESTLACLRQAL